MDEHYLGPEFDVHGGGLDMRFPHHENEQAQYRAAGDGFARYWVHNGWVTLGGEKMSKSLGNTALVDEVVTRVRPVELRYYLATPHYRSTIEFTDAALEEAAAGYRRIESFVRRAVERVGAGAEPTARPHERSREEGCLRRDGRQGPAGPRRPRGHPAGRDAPGAPRPAARGGGGAAAHGPCPGPAAGRGDPRAAARPQPGRRGAAGA